MKKVAIIFDQVDEDSGGLKNASLNLLNVLSKQYEVYCVSIFKSDLSTNIDIKTISDANVNIQIEKLKKEKNSGFRIFGNLFKYFILIPSIRSKMKHSLAEYDYVISSSLSASIFIPKKTCFIQEVHGSYSYFFNGASLGKIQGWLARKPYMYIFRTKYDAELMKSNTSIYSTYTNMVINNIPSEINTSKRDNNACFVGRLSQIKNIPYLIDVAKYVHDRLPSFCLDIYGDGPIKEYLLDRIKKEDLESFVSYKGFLNNMNILQNYSVLIMTSESEGYPLAILDGYKNGVIPVVNKWNESIYDIVNDDSGFVCTEIDEFYKSIDYINSHDVSKMRENGFAIAKQHSSERVLSAWNDIFDKFDKIAK